MMYKLFAKENENEEGLYILYFVSILQRHNLYLV